MRALVPSTDVSIGAMIETPEAVGRAAEIAAEADFLSIGTNDLVQYALGLDRDRPGRPAATAAEPIVLRLVGQVVEAAHAAGRTVEARPQAKRRSQLS